MPGTCANLAVPKQTTSLIKLRIIADVSGFNTWRVWPSSKFVCTPSGETLADTSRGAT